MSFQGAAPSIDVESIRAEAERIFNSDDEAENIDIEELLSEAPLTDTGNAECFACEFGQDYRYDNISGEWLRWEHNCWRKDKKNRVDADILLTVRRRQSAVISNLEMDGAKKLKAVNYLIRCENVRDRKNIKTAAQWLPKFVTTIDQYDSNLYLAATKNGTLNLHTGEFFQSKREDLMSMQIGTDYREDADCPRWKQFVKEIFIGDEELIRYIQKLLGYLLTGNISEQKMFILYGFGKNGKTVFINTIQALAGDYAGAASFKTFDADKQSEQTNDLASLRGKRFVSMVESAADKKLNEPLIKQVTGGDRITCRFLHKEFFDYFPQFKLFLATNHKPVITQTDFGIWRRIVLIPFSQNFDGKEEKGLEETLKSELPGILLWALEGLKLWQAEGLGDLPNAIREATDKYKKDSDTIGQWLELRTVRAGSTATKSSSAYADYKIWSVENGFYPLGNRSFKASLEEKGFISVRRNDGFYWLGFELSSGF